MGTPLSFFSADGKIDGGRHCAACGYACCKTDRDNFIVLFPWELDAARAAGLDTHHLQPISENPQFVHCARPCNGANDYKPINCAAYPLYPVKEDLSEWVRGAKSRCPIGDTRLQKHKEIVADGLRKIEQAYPGSIKMLTEFIRAYPGALEHLR
ncbi:MAG: hypothetical protein LBJ18_01820 [Rickettsiales bacterium]|jgi:Fe-S-cluster containining protein|nr:hypothetical protein [Rickettsiales bacterium]